jgi:hypothetical protein
MIKELYVEAGKIESAEHLAKEAGKLGILRGGTTGAVLDTGEVVGQCHRKALIRFLGLQKSAGGNFWFDMGFANEELWLAKLKKSWPGKIRCEEDYPIEWEVDGTKVTGRPDMVLFDENDKPVAGIELKSVGAINSAAPIRFENKPKLPNLLQAAHYSSQVGVPFYLVYTAFVSGPLPYWAQKQYGEKTIEPFMTEFKVYIDDNGTICYDTEKGKTVKTMVSISNLVDFYRLVADMPRQKNLYSRFKDMDINGKSLPYNVCDYCALQRTCVNFEGNYDRWIEEVQRLKEAPE